MKTSIKKIAHKFFLVALLVLMSSVSLAQNTISGKVIDPKGKPVVSANIYIDGNHYNRCSQLQRQNDNAQRECQHLRRGGDYSWNFRVG
jgi:hypothetical protein